MVWEDGGGNPASYPIGKLGLVEPPIDFALAGGQLSA